MKPKHILAGVLSLLSTAPAIAQQNTSGDVARPKLVVGLVIDQMRRVYIFVLQK